jgi:hypothetical protein
MRVYCIIKEQQNYVVDICNFHVMDSQSREWVAKYLVIHTNISQMQCFSQLGFESKH